MAVVVQAELPLSVVSEVLQVGSSAQRCCGTGSGTLVALRTAEVKSLPPFLGAVLQKLMWGFVEVACPL